MGKYSVSFEWEDMQFGGVLPHYSIHGGCTSPPWQLSCFPTSADSTYIIYPLWQSPSDSNCFLNDKIEVVHTWLKSFIIINWSKRIYLLYMYVWGFYANFLRRSQKKFFIFSFLIVLLNCQYIDIFFIYNSTKIMLFYLNSPLIYLIAVL